MNFRTISVVKVAVMGLSMALGIVWLVSREHGDYRSISTSIPWDSIDIYQGPGLEEIVNLVRWKAQLDKMSLKDSLSVRDSLELRELEKQINRKIHEGN